METVNYRNPKTGEIRKARRIFAEDGSDITTPTLQGKGYEVVETPGKLSAAALGAATGILKPFGSDAESLVDEVGAGIYSILNPSADFQTTRKKIYDAVQTRAQLQPGAFEAGQVGGSVANVIGSIGAAIVGGPIVWGAQIASATGVEFASEYTKGDPAAPPKRTEDERLMDATTQAAITLGFIGAGAAVGKGVAAGVRASRRAVEKLPAVQRRLAREQALIEVDKEVIKQMAAGRQKHEALLSVIAKKVGADPEPITKAERALLRASTPTGVKQKVFLKGHTKQLAGDLGLKSAKGESKQLVTFLRDKMITQPDAVKGQFLGRIKNNLEVKARFEKGIQNLGEDDRGFLSRSFRALSDGRWVFAEMDERFGTKLAPIADKISQKLRIKAAYQSTVDGWVGELDKAAKAANVDITGDAFYRYMSGELKPPPAVEPLVEKGRSIYRQLLQDQQDLGMRITAFEGDYITKSLKSIDERHLATRGQVEAVKQELGGAPFTLQNVAKTEAGKSLIDGLEVLERGKFKFNDATPDDVFQKLLKRHTEVPPANMIDEVLGNEHDIFKFALQRKGDLPDWLVEKNFGKILRKYTHHALHSSVIEPALVEARAAANLLEQLGAKGSHQYIKQWINQLSTGQLAPGTWGRFQRWTKQTELSWRLRHRDAYEKATKEGNKVMASVHKTAYQAPQMWNGLIGTIYANLLGTPRQILVNLSGAFTMGIPELGAKEFGRAFSRVAKMALEAPITGIERTITSPAMAAKLGKRVGDKHTFRSIKGIAEANQTTAPEQHRRVVLGLQEGIEEGLVGPLKTIGDVWRTANNLSMWGFSNVEIMNRMVAAEAGRDIAERMFRKTLSPQLEKAIMRKMDLGYKRQVAQLLAEGKEEVLKDTLAEYFTARIALNYDKAQASFFARNLGTVFSMFSKWPLHTVGEMAYKVRNREAAEAALDIVGKYMAPTVVLMALGAPMKELMGENRYTALIGKGGMVSWAPGTSGAGVLSAEQFTPLPLDLAIEFAESAGRIDPEDPLPGIAKMFTAIYKYIGFGAQYIRVLSSDIPAFVQGDSVDVPPRNDVIQQIYSLFGAR